MPVTNPSRTTSTDPKESALGATRFSFPVVADSRGNLSFIESHKDVPFAIQRVYYLYDVPSGSMRAGHAHMALQQILIAVAGSFDVHLTDGVTKEVITLNRPNVGVFVAPYIWRELHNFSAGGVCLALASMPYEESDYIRDYDKFLETVRTTDAVL